MASSSLAIALLGLLEAISMAKAIAAQTRQKLDINQQCLSEGVANLTGSLFQCFPGSGSLTRSTINQQAGGRTQWSGVISAAAVALTVVLFAPYAYYIPRAGLAGILMLSAWRLVDRQQLVYYLRTTRFDAWIVMLTAISAVAVSVEFCVLIGVFLSFVLYVPQAARVQLTELTHDARARDSRTPGRRSAVSANSHFQPGRRILFWRIAGIGKALGVDRRGDGGRMPRRGIAAEARQKSRRGLHEGARSVHRATANSRTSRCCCAACGPI